MDKPAHDSIAVLFVPLKWPVRIRDMKDSCPHAMEVLVEQQRPGGGLLGIE
jgi:hypothetical protein